MEQVKTEMKHKYLSDYLASDAAVKCQKCGAEMAESKMAEQMFVCPECKKYNRVPARVRIEMLCDKGTFEELNADVVSNNPIGFPEYEDKIKSATKKSQENEGVICGKAKIASNPCCIFVMESNFMMGSMGSVVGDKITAVFEYATAHSLPVIGYTVSGGARMQEGMISLMQMAKVSGAVKRHNDAGNFYLVCATDPTTGGVTASFAMLGDVIISEPGALVGFAGKRVIEQVTGEKLPDTFQSAEFQLKNGFLDAIVERSEHREYISTLLKMHRKV